MGFAPVWRNRLIALALALVLLIGFGGYQGYNLLLRRDFVNYTSLADQFKYGSIGNEDDEGIPYWLWLVLPRVFSDKLPGAGGYTSLGMTWEPGHEVPVGISKQTIGFPRVGINCAICHTATFRTTPDQPPVIVPGGPSSKLDSLAYLRFLWSAAADERFTADYLMPSMEYVHKFGWLEKQLYRYLVIPLTRDKILKQAQEFAWTAQQPTWGSGRIDPMNRIRFKVLGLPIDNTAGNSDMTPLWNMQQHQGFAYHWDGLQTSLHEAVISGAFGNGATKKSLPLANLAKIEEFIDQVQPPTYPAAIDQALVAKGKPIFQANCATCHAFGGTQTGQVLNNGDTDPQRLTVWSQAAADAYNAFGNGEAWDLEKFRKTAGYVSPSLDGIWLRAPYLHNGSVPTLTDLLTKPVDRPTTFYRGYDLYDADHIGFVTTGKNSAKLGTPYDTKISGNSNQGHLYGTELSPDQKQALLEYLKTL
jgi:mono/diheme cytochrome c family protein